MLSRYDLIYYALMPGFVPWLAWRSLTKKKYRESARGMLGLDLPIGAYRDQWRDGSVWVHAVSVGETVAAKSIAPHLRQLLPDLPLLATTITETGQAQAHKILNEAQYIHYFPLDFSWNVRRFLRCFKPQVFIMMETELWPNFLTLAAQQGADIFMVNGKLSEKSFRGYRKGRFVLRSAFRNIRAFCMQTEEDAQRMTELCGRPEDVFVTGNCKFDAPMEPLDPDVAEAALRQYRLGKRPRLVVGSTHPGEEEIMLRTFEALRQKEPALQMILSPRHPERFSEVYQKCRKHPAQWKISKASAPVREEPDIMVLDTMGELARIYGLGDVAVVAGSFVPIGGHNLLEAACHAVPVLVGPHMHAQKELNRLFQGDDSGCVRSSSENLVGDLARLFADPGLREKKGKQALATARSNQGSARASVEIIRQYLQKGAADVR